MPTFSIISFERRDGGPNFSQEFGSNIGNLGNGVAEDERLRFSIVDD